MALAAENHDASCMLQAQRSELTPQQLIEEKEDLKHYERVVKQIEEQTQSSQHLLEQQESARADRLAKEAEAEEAEELTVTKLAQEAQQKLAEAAKKAAEKAKELLAAQEARDKELLVAAKEAQEAVAASSRKTLAGIEERDQEEDATQLFCEFGTTTLDFKSFSHGDVITPNIISGVKITGARRKASLQNPCTGPLMILNNKEGGASNDPDLETCVNCAMLVYSEDGNTQVVDDCAERPGPKFIFEWDEVKDLKNILLWDQDDGNQKTKVRLFGPDNALLTEAVIDQQGSMNGKGTTVDLRTRGVKRMEVDMAGSGAIVRIRQCAQDGSEFGDPHIFTLDGQKFDLYENGTYSLFHYSGRKTKFLSAGNSEKNSGDIDWQLFAHYGGPTWTALGLLLVDKSNGDFQNALELTAKDCQWRRKSSLKGSWSDIGENSSVSLLEGGDYISNFEFHNEKHISLRMNTLDGLTESIKLHTVCKPKGINVRVSLPDVAESRFLKGQIEVGNGKRQNKFAVDKKWTAIGGSDYAKKYFDALAQEKYTLLTSCTNAEKQKAEKICAKHLGEKMKNAKGAKGAIFSDCVFDVCRGGEEFAIAAAEMLKKN